MKIETEGKRPLGSPRCRGWDNVKINVKEEDCVEVN
jgi:hypothetical protein